jgi:hypothetical protein
MLLIHSWGTLSGLSITPAARHSAMSLVMKIEAEKQDQDKNPGDYG